jgi:hypothetical protein
MSQSPKDVMDYSTEKELSNSHYNGVPSMYGKLVDEQMKQQPKYCWPGEVGGGLEGEHSNTQLGP